MKPSDLPASALERLQLKSGTPFSAHFGVNELLMLASHNYEPVGQVLGASVFQTGIQWTGGGWRDSERRAAAEKGISYELTQATSAFYQARHLALQRMAEEAQLLGASLVVGAKIERRDLVKDDEHQNIFEFYARGTALKLRGQRPTESKPVLSSLTGPEVCQLLDAGYNPAGIVVGNCYWFHIPNQNSGWLLTATALSQNLRTNQELPDVTQAVYQAREMAMSRLEAEARALKADGVLGLQIDTDFPDEHELATMNSASVAYAFRTVAVHFLALGTAVHGRGTRGTQEIRTVVTQNK